MITHPEAAPDFEIPMWVEHAHTITQTAFGLGCALIVALGMTCFL